jgi:hypothetical protein
MLGLAAPMRAEESAAQVFEAGRRAEHAGDTLNALLLYARAASLEPANSLFAGKRATLQAKAAQNTFVQMAPSAQAGSRALAPLVELSPIELQQAREALPPPRLRPRPGRKSFDLRGDARMIFEQVAEAFGFAVAFEPEYQSPPEFRFQVTDLDMEETLRTLEAVSNSILVPLTDRVVMVARDTPQRRADTIPVMAAVVPIPERMSVQDAQEIVTAVQQTLEIRRIVVDPGRRVVFLRDQVGKVIAARALFGELSRLRPQVEVEVELLSLSRTSSFRYGVGLPTLWPVLNFSTALNNVTPKLGGFTNFLAFGGGATFMGIGVANASAFATASRGLATTLTSTQLVAVDGQAATLHVGDRYPIITAGYYGNTTGTGQVFTPPPTVSFVDLGMVVKVTPTVHEGGEITIEMDAQHNVLGADGGNGIPIVSSTKYQGKVRLTSGQWAVVAGLVRTTASVSRTGIAGVSELPLIGPVLRDNTQSQESQDTLIILKPRIVNLPPWDTPAPAIWVGTESRPATAY